WEWTNFPSNIGLFRQGSARLVMLIPKDGYKQILVYYAQKKTKDEPFNADPTTYDGVQMQVIENKRDGKEVNDPNIHFRTLHFDPGKGSIQLEAQGGR